MSDDKPRILPPAPKGLPARLAFYGQILEEIVTDLSDHDPIAVVACLSTATGPDMHGGCVAIGGTHKQRMNAICDLVEDPGLNPAVRHLIENTPPQIVTPTNFTIN